MSRKLLVADDSVTIQRVVELMFADEDMEVVAVGDGRQAIERIDAEDFDVVLADVGMPERDGYEVTAFIKHTPRHSHIPVILLTGAFEPLDQARAREAGVDAVLAKPFEPSLAVTRVKELLEGKKPQEAEHEPAVSSTQASTPSPRGPLMAPRSADLLHEPLTVPAQAASAGAQIFSRMDVEPEHAEVSDAAVDAYFDRLDASFAGLEAATVSGDLPREARSATEAWRAQDVDIDQFTSTAADVSLRGPAEAPPEPMPERIEPRADLSRGVSARPVTVPTVVVQQVRPAQAAPPPAVPAQKAPSAPVPSATVTPQVPLGDAFAALLAAEQAERKPGGARTGRMAAAMPGASQELVEAITNRVMERLTDSLVRDTVAEAVASVVQRFVREELQQTRSRGGQ